MKKNIEIIIILTISVFLIAILIFGHKSKETKTHDFISVQPNENIKISSEKNYVFTSKDELEKYFEIRNVEELDFQENNYILIPIRYDSCSEEEIQPTNYQRKGSILEITVEYQASCGVCASSYLYYLLKIEKEEKINSIQYQYKAKNNPHCDPAIAYKPMIYLYPEKEQAIEVSLGYPDLLTVTYPKYENGWKVTATPDGTIKLNNREYYGLYWEGKSHKERKVEEGFIVEKNDIINFLEEKLKVLGLNDKEANEFIIYWLPKLSQSNYNYIYFKTKEEIDENMPLLINPKPETIIRVFMDYKPLKEKITVKEQVLISPERKGFTVVEWGGGIQKD